MIFLYLIIFFILSWIMGVYGFMVFEGDTMVNAGLNSALMLSNLDSSDRPATFQGKLFITLYAFYCGIIFITGVSLFSGYIVQHYFFN